VVVRYPHRCSSCGLVTILRLQVSNRSAEPFRFQCQGCTNNITGVFDTDQRVHRVLGISELVGATMAESERGAGAVHTYTHFLEFTTSKPPFHQPPSRPRGFSRAKKLAQNSIWRRHGALDGCHRYRAIPRDGRLA
jgi:hypothetical protein